jgi:Cu+-exporting ATPase
MPGAARVTFPVQGMTCAACQAFVQKTLAERKGVREATVNLLLHNATVEYDPVETGPAELVDAVNETGYQAELPAPGRSLIEDERRREREAEAEYRALRLRAIATLAAGSGAMAAMPWMHHGPAAVPLRWTLAAVSLAALVWAGRRFFVKAWAALRRGGTDMNTLVALGAGSAFVYSVFSPHDVYYEAVLFILGFVLTGNALEARAKSRATAALAALAKLAPASARVERSGREEEIPVEHLRPGDILVVRPGERLPADGVVLSGHSGVDESMLTGESVPVDKGPGSPVIAGTLNGHGLLRSRVTALGSETVLERVMRLLRDAQLERPPLQRMADRISAVFVPAVILLALLTLGAWLLAGAALPRALTSAVAVLLIACPCAMGLAVPAAVMVATGRAARLGFLFQGGEVLERLERVDTIVFDKTGTLTEGRPEVFTFEPVAPFKELEALSLAAALEQASEHPLGAAVVRHARARGAKIPPADRFTSLPGLGAEAEINGHQVLAGRRELLAARGIEAPEESTHAAAGRTVLWFAVDGKPAALCAVADVVRPSSAPAVAALRARGHRVLMVTGDQEATARCIASTLGIDEVVAGVLPEGKLEALRRLRAEGRVVAMVGDGVNDAPALAAADAGIAMASGTDVAAAAAGLTLMRPDLSAIVDALALAVAAGRTMRMNLFWALAYNVVAIPAAALGWLSPALAAAAMSLSSVSVVANSLRLNRVKLR